MFMKPYDSAIPKKPKTIKQEKEKSKYEQKLEELIETQKKKTDEEIKYRRSVEDALYNLDFENMPTVYNVYVNDKKAQNAYMVNIETLASYAKNQAEAVGNHANEQFNNLAVWQNDTATAIAGISATANSAGATATQLAQWKETVYVNDQIALVNSIAAVSTKANSVEATATMLATWQATAYVNDQAVMANTIAAAYAVANSAAAQAGLVVQNGQVNGSIIVTAINNQSTAEINANRINFTGFTTFLRPSDVNSSESTTTIYGGLIQTNTLDVGTIKNTVISGATSGVVFPTGVQTMSVYTKGVYPYGGDTGITLGMPGGDVNTLGTLKQQGTAVSLVGHTHSEYAPVAIGTIANNAYDMANSAYSMAATANNNAGNAYSTANNAYSTAQSAYTLASTAYNNAGSAYTMATTANNNASGRVPRGSNVSMTIVASAGSTWTVYFN
jgi:hypothetical protein